MTATRLLPFALGASMGIMLPFALHASGTGGAALFAALHALALGAIAIGGRWLLRRSGRLPRWARHRPSIGHACLMLAGAAAGFAGLHVLAHGAAV